MIPPQPIHPVTPDIKALIDQHRMDHAVAVTRMLTHQAFHGFEQRRLVRLGL